MNIDLQYIQTTLKSTLKLINRRRESYIYSCHDL